ncbi:MAG: tetratricopeptide repeat protein, partial [Caulobacterales bacterium]|nr:tetratricopeptide repeat protein [Caulobacterales bacterium]
DKGRPVDGFMGAIPPSEVAKFVERLAGAEDGSPEIEALAERARAALEAGDVGGAAQDFAQILQHDREHLPALAGLARCYIANGDPERAQEVIAGVPEDQREDPEVKSVLSAIELAAGAQDDDEVAALISHVSASPDDHAKRFELAQALAAKGDMDAAVDHLLAIVRADREWSEDAARTELLKIFEAAGPTSALAREGRRKLSAILFS